VEDETDKERPMVGETWQTDDTRALFDAILDLGKVDEAERFFRDLCTMGELHDLAQRWAVVRLLDDGLHYADISRRTGASTATITRIASWLNHGEGGYRSALSRLKTGGGKTRRAKSETKKPDAKKAGSRR
jgi:TrpR-related protein YerC/YecD